MWGGLNTCVSNICVAFCITKGSRSLPFLTAANLPIAFSSSDNSVLILDAIKSDTVENGFTPTNTELSDPPKPPRRSCVNSSLETWSIFFTATSIGTRAKSISWTGSPFMALFTSASLIP